MGHRFLTLGIRCLVMCEAVVQFPRPTTQLELQLFLRLVNFYRWFLRGAAVFLLPLTNALQGPGKSSPWFGLRPWTRPSTPPRWPWPLLPSSTTPRQTFPSASWAMPPTPTSGLSLVLGPTLLLLQEAEAHQDPLQRLGQGPQLSCLAPSALLLFLLNTKTFFVAQAACSATAALVADWRFHVEKRLLADGHVLLCSTSTDVDCPLLPPEFCHPAFDTLLPLLILASVAPALCSLQDFSGKV